MDVWQQDKNDSITGLPLEVALHIDNIRQSREGFKKEINWNPIYQLNEKLQKHHQAISQAIENNELPSYDSTFLNPLFNTILKQYNTKIEDYNLNKKEDINQYLAEMQAGINQIISTINDLDKNPTSIKITDLGGLVNFCVSLSRQERYYYPRWQLAA